MTPADVRVRAETAFLGLAPGGEITLTRTALVEAAIASGRFTVLDSDGAPAPLKGAALEDALKAADLPTSGSADEKRARLAAHLEAEADAASGPGPVEPVTPGGADVITRTPGAPVIGTTPPATPAS